MERRVIEFEAPFLDVEWDGKTECVYMRWKQFVHGDGFRTGLDAGLRLLIARGATKWLADLRRIGAIGKDDQEWVNTDWFPRALRAGIRQMALVMPETAVATMSVAAIMSDDRNVRGFEQHGLVTAHFADVATAKRWLSGDASLRVTVQPRP